jgi:hypothetical protein
MMEVCANKQRGQPALKELALIAGAMVSGVAGVMTGVLAVSNLQLLRT